MRVLVTGGSGFIGKHVVTRLLKEQHSVLIFAKDEMDGNALSRNGVTCIAGTLDRIGDSSSAIEDFAPDACVHLAWEGIPDYSAETSFRNLDNSVKVMDFVAGMKTVKKLVVSGSCFEYGKKMGPCRESEPANIQNYFAWAKDASRSYMMLKCRDAGISLLWLRFFYVYGPGQRGNSLIPSVAGSLMKDIAPSIKMPCNANDFVYVADVADAVATAVAKDVETGIFNVGSGSSCKVADVCGVVGSLLGTDAGLVKKLCNDNPVCDTDFWADMSTTQDKLAWQAGTDLESGIRQYLESVGAL